LENAGLTLKNQTTKNSIKETPLRHHLGANSFPKNMAALIENYAQNIANYQG
jgi:hypothetical protein